MQQLKAQIAAIALASSPFLTGAGDTFAAQPKLDTGKIEQITGLKGAHYWGRGKAADLARSLKRTLASQRAR